MKCNIHDSWQIYKFFQRKQLFVFILSTFYYILRKNGGISETYGKASNRAFEQYLNRPIDPVVVLWSFPRIARRAIDR